MALEVSIRKMVLNFTEGKDVKYVASANRGKVIAWPKVVDQIHLRSGIGKQQVRSVIATLVDAMATFLEEGHGVRLDGFGTFVPAVVSDSADVPDKAGVKKVKVTFLPSQTLRTMMAGINVSTTDAEGSTTPGGGTEPPAGGGGELG